MFGKVIDSSLNWIIRNIRVSHKKQQELSLTGSNMPTIGTRFLVKNMT